MHPRVARKVLDAVEAKTRQAECTFRQNNRHPAHFSSSTGAFDLARLGRRGKNAGSNAGDGFPWRGFFRGLGRFGLARLSKRLAGSLARPVTRALGTTSTLLVANMMRRARNALLGQACRDGFLNRI